MSATFSGGGTASVAVNLAASGQIIAAPGAGKKIRVYGVNVVTRVDNDIKFQSAGNDVTGPLPCKAGGGVAWSSVRPLFECNINEALNLNLTVANTVGGVLQYDVV